MRFPVRCLLLVVLAASIIAASAPAAQAAFGVEKFVAVDCSEGFEECAEQKPFGPFSEPKEPSQEEAEDRGFTQAGGHVPFGVSDFKVNTEGELAKGEQKPVEGKAVTHIRTDVAPGLATSPAAVPQCPQEEFGTKEAVPGTGFYLAPKCSEETVDCENKATVYVPGAPPPADVTREGTGYNLVQREGLASDFGLALKLPKELTEGFLFQFFKGSKPEIEKEQYFAHSL